MLKRLREMFRAEPPPSPAPWRTIDTAPRGGIIRLATNPKPGDPGALGWWDSHSGQWLDAKTLYPELQPAPAEVVTVSPTHWKPAQH